MPIKFTERCGGKVVQKRVTELENPVFKDVYKEVQQWLGFGKWFYLTYEDDEGDVIRLGSDVELRMCIAQWRARQGARLVITVQSSYNMFVGSAMFLTKPVRKLFSN